MFVIVDLSDDRKRRFEKYRKHIIETKRCDILGGAPFFIAKGHKTYFEKEELERIIKRCGTALFKDGYIPDGFEKYQFLPSVLPLRMLVQSAVAFFSENPETGRNLTLSIFDDYAFAAEETEALSQYVRFVKVITKRRDLYCAVQQKVYNLFGAVITVGEDASLAEKSDCVIALNDSQLMSFGMKCALVYCKSSYCGNVFAVCESSFFMRKFDNETKGIDDFLFLCALFETCGYKIREIPVFNDAKFILSETFT